MTIIYSKFQGYWTIQVVVSQRRRMTRPRLNVELFQCEERSWENNLYQADETKGITIKYKMWRQQQKEYVKMFKNKS